MECRTYSDQRSALARVVIGFILLALGAALLLTWTDWDNSAIVPDTARPDANITILNN